MFGSFGIALILEQSGNSVLRTLLKYLVNTKREAHKFRTHTNAHKLSGSNVYESPEVLYS